MSFKAELEALIANASSSLEDLEAVIRRAKSRWNHSNGRDAGDGELREIQAQLDTVRQRIRTSLVEIRESYNHDQERLSDLEGELKLDLENVRQCAIDYFIKGEYRECERLLAFLAKVQPYDENLKNFLDLSRRKQLEPERERTHAEANNRSQSPENRDIPKTRTCSDDLQPPLSIAGGSTLPPLAAGGESDGPASTFLPHSEAESETIKPQILAEIELKTPAHIHQTYRTLPSSTKPRLLVWVIVVALGVATSLYWLSKSRLGSSSPQSLSGPQSKVEEPAASQDPLESLRQEAQALFDAGKLQEAKQVCDAILSKESQDRFAVFLRATIRATLPESKTSTDEPVASQRTGQSEPAGAESPEVHTASIPVRNQPLPSEAASPRALSSDRSIADLRRIDATVQKLGGQRPGSEQSNPAKHATPAPVSVGPTIPPASQVATAPQIQPDQLLEVNSKIQAKDFDHARLLLERLESGFPGNPDLRTLAERLRVEASKQQSEAFSWIEKAEAAWIAGRYVTPPDDNVVVYCNLSLKADPKNQRATNLKREIVHRAVAQAQDWIERGKFDAARLSYASMDYLATGDAAFPYSKTNLKRELYKLEFRTYPMVHDHRLGSCSGMLKFNSYAVSFVPSGGSDDAFTESLKSIVINDEGERLKIGYRDRSFRLRGENGNVVQSIYQQLMTRMSDEKSTLADSNKAAR